VSVTAVPGFEAAGVACGVKPSGEPDLALVATADRRAIPAAGVFTRNRVQAAPVQISQAHLEDGQAGAVVLNAGNANAATGEPGRDHARRMCACTAHALGLHAEDVLVCSTGLIGIPLPIDAVEAGIDDAAPRLASGSDAGLAAAEAILTTDTVAKQATALVEPAGYRVGGMAKGAAMLAPSMATMLAVLTTDANVSPGALRDALRHAVTDTFNALIVDGCTSTNDTVLVLASGAAGTPTVDGPGPGFDGLVEALSEVCESLARAMGADAEGATKLARVVVSGAPNAAAARHAARTVASSQLVQCSLYGSDPYWGRVLSELGASGIEFDPERVDLAYNGVTVCHRGVAALHDEEALERAMAQRDIEIHCDLHAGPGRAEVLFTDLTHGYIDENRGTS
jgi:glutamate N-acetyltransferase/amino-acid N-acetyltransferase